MVVKKNNNLNGRKVKIFGMFLYLFLWAVFLVGVVIGLVGGYLDDIILMKIGLYPVVVCGIFMGILHILCLKVFLRYLGLEDDTKK